MKARGLSSPLATCESGRIPTGPSETPTVRKVKSAIVPVDRIKVPGAGRPRVETGGSAVADLGAPTAVRPTLAEQAALDKIDLSVDLRRSTVA